MIQVHQLTKYYGDYAAIHNVSFDVDRGQVVGFLGPNGAGKTTTMRILTGYLTATSGRATIDGFDVFWQPLQARQRIGYMPENCPLYPDMRVKEFLRFRAGLKGLHGRPAQVRVDYVMGRCWLVEVSRQLIGTLSKGFRQRVGLADALLADPPVLILDEPTSGLDPAQIRETRALIRELGRQHTILLSTHILPEVEMTCDRVIIINRGRVAASSSLAELSTQAPDTALIVEVDGVIDPAPIQELGVTDLEREHVDGGTRLTITCNDAVQLTPRLCALASDLNWKIRHIRPQQRTLEEMFVRIIESDMAEEVAAR
ncbi:MAG: ABC transporter ATP-binding protein [Gemmataceae bacterium]